MNQVTRALHERDLTGFLGLLQRETWLIDEAFVSFQDELIGAAASDGREALFAALLDLALFVVVVLEIRAEFGEPVARDRHREDAATAQPVLRIA